MRQWISILLTLGIFGSTMALAAPLTWNSDATASLTSPAVNFTVASGSTADSFVVNATSVAVTLSSSTGGTFVLTSASRDLSIATSSGGGTVTTSCTSGVASTSISQSTSSTVYTISPAAAQCTAASSGSTTPAPSASAGIGGGGGFFTSQFTAVSIIIPQNNAMLTGQATILVSVANPSQVVGVKVLIDGIVTGKELLAAPYSFALDTRTFPNGSHVITARARNPYGDVAVSNGVTVFVANTSATPGGVSATTTPGSVGGGGLSDVFLRNLTLGDRGTDVSLLQQILVKEDVYPGGLVTGYFGMLTQAAVRRFQEKYGVATSGAPGYGLVGPKTRVALNALYKGLNVNIPAVPIPPPASGAFPRITGTFYYTQRGASVSLLQRMLAEDVGVYPEGRITGYFGPLTASALRRFQEKFGIAAPGVPGYGLVGPKTKAKLNELYAQ